MDHRLQVVLDHYHARITEERARFRTPGAAAQGPGDWRDEALLAVGPETGQLINVLAGSFDAPNILELGTSFGYSGLWLADAARRTGGRVITMELHPHKSIHARQQAEVAGLADWIDYRVGDAVQLIEGLDIQLDFVLVDLWKDLYVPCLDRFYPKLRSGALIVADNMIRPGGEDARRYRDAVRNKSGITSVLLPVGSGLEVSRYAPQGD